MQVQRSDTVVVPLRPRVLPAPLPPPPRKRSYLRRIVWIGVAILCLAFWTSVGILLWNYVNPR